MKAMKWCVVGVCVSAMLAVGGCASEQKGAAKSAAAGPSPAEMMFGQIKGLAGTWEMVDEKGTKQVGVVYRVVAGGSAVCEQMFPGSEHEMVNMYHMDGDRVLVTHYCAAGNQPRMVATGAQSKGVLVFSPESVTNLATPDTEYMATLELDMPDADHLTQKWTSQKSGKATEHATFAMTRRR